MITLLIRLLHRALTRYRPDPMRRDTKHWPLSSRCPDAEIVFTRK